MPETQSDGFIVTLVGVRQPNPGSSKTPQVHSGIYVIQSLGQTPTVPCIHLVHRSWLCLLRSVVAAIG